MSDSRFGIIIAGESGSMKDDTIYNSRRQKFTVDPDANPVHFDILHDFGGGTKWSVGATDETLYEETLFEIKHDMPFTPHCLAFFYPTKIPFGGTAPARQYSMNRQLMLFNAISLGEEWIEIDADEENFYIKHKAYRFNFGGPDPFVFYGSDYEFRIRYFIFNQPTFLIPGGVSPSD